MSDLANDLYWKRAEPVLPNGKSVADHTVHRSKSNEIQVDAAPDWGGKSESNKSEPTLASGLSRCHMMRFLASALKTGGPVAPDQGYADARSGKTDTAQMPMQPNILQPAFLQRCGGHRRMYRNTYAPVAGFRVL